MFSNKVLIFFLLIIFFVHYKNNVVEKYDDINNTTNQSDNSYANSSGLFSKIYHGFIGRGQTARYITDQRLSLKPNPIDSIKSIKGYDTGRFRNVRLY